MTKKKRVLIHNSSEQEIVLIGIDGGGKILADNLAAILKKISPLRVVVSSIEVNKKKPLSSAITFNEDLTGRAVVLVDDVVNSGKTMIYSLHSILSYDIKKLMVAVLVDRKHKSFPIASDIVGHTVATTLQEHIEVETAGDEIIAVYLE